MRRGLALVASTACVLAACGGEDDFDARRDARYKCIQDAQTEAGARVVAGFYARGALGDARAVEAQLKTMVTPGFETESFLTREGRILSWRKMNDGQRATFDIWKRTDAVQNVVEKAEFRAIRRARERARASCPPA